MIGNRNASAWVLACSLFERSGPIILSALSDFERNALALLIQFKAVKPLALDMRYLLCPYCQLHRGLVVQGHAGLECQCPDCGPVEVETQDKKAWMIDVDWLIRKLRGALDIPAQQATVSITSDIWRIGTHRRHPVIIGRHLDRILLHPGLQFRSSARSTNPTWLITPKPPSDIHDAPGGAVWLPLEERFSLYGGNLTFLEPGEMAEPADSNQPVHGPFSKDFRWVHLPNWSHGAIFLSEAQSAVFKALWHFNATPQTAERIMGKAGLESSKPIDIFKVKKQNKGDPRYEGPYHAYQTLVKTDRRAGTYAMPCSASVTA